MPELSHKPGMTLSSTSPWTDKVHHAFVTIKKALQSPPTLGIQDPTKTFVQAIGERKGCITSVPLQKHGLEQVLIFQISLTRLLLAYRNA